jgi:hypothetical protein
MALSLAHGPTTRVDERPLHDVGPYPSEELSRLYDALRPRVGRAVATLAREDGLNLHDARKPTRQMWAYERLVEELGVDLWYARSIVERVARFDGREEEIEDADTRAAGQLAWTDDVLTSPDAHPDPTRDLADLRDDVCTLLEAADVDAPVRLHLDGPAWDDVGDKRTARSLLDALATVAETVDLTVRASPDTEALLERRWPEWVDEHLTEPGNSDPQEAPSADAVDTDTTCEVYATLREWQGRSGEANGRRRLLASLPREEWVDIPTLVDDPEIGLKRGSVYRYLNDLQAAGLVERDDTTSLHRVRPTDRGVVGQDLLTESYRLQHPDQTRVSANRTGAPQSLSGIVCRANRDTEGREGQPAGETAGRTAEAVLADVDRPEGTDGFTQWLGEPGEDWRVRPSTVHRRLSTAARVEGVTCVDHPIEPLADGRVSQVSIFDDELLVALQWGGAGATLGRLAAVLSSGRIWGKILTRDVVGEDLEHVHGGAFASDDLVDVLRHSTQIGWLGPDEERYHALKDRLHNAGRRLLGRLSKLQRGDLDDGEVSQFYRDAHGLATTMTALLSSVGVDVTVNLRIPDTQMLQSDEQRFREFREFIRHTVPKHARYGVHSAPRHLTETREDKLAQRASIGDAFDPQDPTASLTASWLITGPDADDLVEPISHALGTVEVREAVREGHEDAPVIDVPVVSGNTYAAVRHVVEEFVEAKGYFPLEDDRLRQFTRLLMAVLGEEAYRASPITVAEALQGIARTETRDIELRDVEAAVASLPSERIFPTLRPTQQRMLSALLAADEPLSRSELIDWADVSESSYDRNHAALAGVDVVEHTGEGWIARLNPWWSPSSPVSEPDRDNTEDAPTACKHADWQLHELALGIDRERGTDYATADVWHEQPPPEDLRDRLPDVARWIPFVRTLLESSPDAVGESTPPTWDDRQARREAHAVVGRPPPVAADEQATLPEGASA